jgi:hypothetical protein
MRNLVKTLVDKYRIEHPTGGWGDSTCGAFKLPLYGSKLTFNVIASSGGGWEHVSVSTEERCPKWNEMQKIKELFFNDEEVVMQLHPPQSSYVNVHPNCLHLWRPQHLEIPLPDTIMV